MVSIFGGAEASEGAIPPVSQVVFVSTEGVPGASGSREDPVDSIAAARDLLDGETSADSRGVVYVRGGTYPIETTTAFTGTENSYVTYTAYRGEKVEFTGARTLNADSFQKLADVSGAQYSSSTRLQASVHDQVYVMDLKAAGISAGEINKNGFNWVQQSLPPELLVDGANQTLAQYPNGDSKLTRTDLEVVYAPQGARDFFSDKTDSTKTYDEMLELPGPIFKPKTAAVKERFLQWAPPKIWSQQVNQPPHSADTADPYYVDNSTHETDGWLSGYFGTDWATENVQIYSAADDGYNLRSHFPTMYKATSSGGVYSLTAQNILYELDVPGEYYIDRWQGNDVLYYLPADGTIDGKSIQLTSLSEPFFTLDGVADVAFNGFSFVGGTGVGMQLLDCESCTVENSEFSNFSLDAIRVGEDNQELTALAEYQTRRGGHGNRILNSSFHDLGGGGVWLAGGDRKSLERGDNLVSGNEFWNTSKLTLATYTPAITLAGVGNTASYNFIHDTPHMALQIFGNDMLITHNRFKNVVTSAADQAAVYSGRDFTYLGNEVSYNSFEDILGDRRWAIYLDDGMSAMNIHHNLFQNGSEAIYINSGRASQVTDNLFVDHETAGFELSFRTKHALTLPIPNQKVHVERFNDMLKAGDGTGFTNTQANIDTWLAQYGERYPDLTSWYWPSTADGTPCAQIDAATCSEESVYENPNSLLVPGGMTISHNVLINTPDEGPGGQSWPEEWRFTEFNYAHYNPGIDSVRATAGTPEEIGWDSSSRTFSSTSSLDANPDFGAAWIDSWNSGFSSAAAGNQPIHDKSELWAQLDAADTIGPDAYPAEGLATVRGALTQAILVDASGTSTLEQIATATNDLRDALEALVGPDSDRPEVTLISPTTSGPMASLTVQVDARDSGGLKRIVANIYQNSALVKSTQSPGNGAVAASHSAVVTLPDGIYSIRYNAQDRAGNISKTSSIEIVIDATKPTVEVKEGAEFTLDSGEGHNMISFKLFDDQMIDRIELNGVARDLANDKWSDVNFVKPPLFGSVLGTNTLIVYDVAGNSETHIFTLN